MMNNSLWKKWESTKRGLIILFIINLDLISSTAQNDYSAFDNLDISIDPCEDFYKFACGKFLNTTILPDDKIYVDAYSLVEDKIQMQLKNSLEEEFKPNDARHVKMIKTFYRNCINETAINSKGLQAAVDILNKLGGWPVLEGDSWKDDNFNWEQLVSKFKKESLPVVNFFDSGVISDLKNSSKRILYIDQPFLDLTHENIKQGLNDSTIEAYYNYMVDIAIIFGADETKARDELKRSVLFEMNLVNISSTEEERDYNNLTTIKELEINYSFISWKEYFSNLLNPNNEADENDEVLVKDPNFFSEFEKVMVNFTKRDQANFIMWKVVREMISYLNDDVRGRELKFLTYTTGQKEREPRWKECILLANDNFGHSIGSIYVRNYFNKDSRNDVEEIFNNIKEEFGNILRTLNWLDDTTKENLLEKLMSIRALIGYTDELLDDRKIDEFYQNLEITDGDHVESMLNLTLFNENYLLGLWKKPVNTTSWNFNVSPVIVDTYYELNTDSLYQAEFSRKLFTIKIDQWQ
ncbi:neprilysin-2-like isoform X2 [Leptopilina boulardi]|uniref:neprilysin-2-like isoform X2 n=1 Tax=Leptopilina boulardi TaxID=63433 RepID=UPI0021F68805|nr:neprilysin-2-like isoform X2 [Leptopilina boulardi]